MTSFCDYIFNLICFCTGEDVEGFRWGIEASPHMHNRELQRKLSVQRTY